MVTIFDATSPANPLLIVNIFSPIKPAVVRWALHGVNAGLINGVRVAGDSN
jgi:hypothetical protein